jgi:Cu2+-exporting ATPase
LPLGTYWRPADGPFCCHGCRAVYSLIHDEGLERYYDLRRGESAPPAELRTNNFAWLDDLLASAPTLESSTVRRLQLDIQGIHCAACVWLLEKLFQRHAGGVQLRINPAIGSVDVLWDGERGDLVTFLREVESFGYRFGPARKEAPRASRGILVRIGICAAVAANVMMFSITYYLGLAPDEPVLFDLLGNLNLGLATIALIVGGQPFIGAAWRGLRRGLVHLDLPIALGIMLAYAGSVWAHFSVGPRAAYFDTLTIFVLLMLVGRFLQERVVERNRNTLLQSGGVADLYTRRFEEGIPRSIPAVEVQAQDELWIAPGDLVPVEGVVMRAEAMISLDWITGEPHSMTAGAGTLVPAGAFNVGNQGFRLTASEGFSGSRLNELIRADEARAGDAAEHPTDRSQIWWQRVGSAYVAVVLVAAVAAFLLGLRVSLFAAVERAVAVLVVTCPCALGLGLPLGRELAHAALRRLGVLLRRDSFLDRALQLRKVVFDKTGTLTRGRLHLASRSERVLRALDEEERTILHSMASRSSHPVSRCVADTLDRWARTAAATESAVSGVLSVRLDAIEEVPGAGLRLLEAGHDYRFGSAIFAHADDEFSGDRDARARAVVFAVDGTVRALLEVEEDLRRDAADEVGALRAAGLDVYVYSGDAQARVEEVARELGIDGDHCRGELSPEAKAEAVRTLDRNDTMMVGDGLNDSPSFDAAYCTATPAVDRAVLSQKADFYFLGDGIGALRQAIATARHLRRVQNGNLWFAGVYNGAAILLCLFGWVQPVVAAVLMPLSSVSIVLLTTHRMSAGRPRWIS